MCAQNEPRGGRRRAGHDRPLPRTIWGAFAAAAVVLLAFAGAAPVAAQDQPAPIRPDSVLTPGAVLDVSDTDVCTPGYSKRVRHVTAETKRAVYAEYGITAHAPGDYEVDHLISLEIGGSNSIKNLWPESYLTEPWNARVKDKLENRLHQLVCAGTISLKEAQDAIAKDWIAAYTKFVCSNVRCVTSRRRT